MTSANCLYSSCVQKSISRFLAFPILPAGQQHLLLRRNGRRVKKNIKKKCGFESSPEHKPLFADAFIPVSYTHLDVYKRQELPRIFCFEQYILL